VLPILAVIVGAVWYKYRAEGVRGDDLWRNDRELLTSAIGVFVAAFLLVPAAASHLLPRVNSGGPPVLNPRVPPLVLAWLEAMPVYIIVFLVLLALCAWVTRSTRQKAFAVRTF